MISAAAQPPQPAGLPAALQGLGRTLVFGVLNVTPDSFSDGGRFADESLAVAAGLELHRSGADVVDVGGESTRPGAERVSAAEERARVLPVIEGLVRAGVPVSIDTMRAELATEAVEAGAAIVNDVSGGLADPQMLPAVAPLPVPYVAMHWRGHGWYMDENARYTDVVAEVAGELTARLDACETAGLAVDRVAVDPGIGFAKLPEHNWALLRGLATLAGLGRPLFLGASRKRFLGALLADASGPRPIPQREAATLATTALAAAAGVWAVRVHDVAASADAVRVAAAWKGAS
ncbi:MAG: dihydropteroate synthase [Actinomycetota bacterium]|jgi:dihydropteroate synthase